MDVAQIVKLAISGDSADGLARLPEATLIHEDPINDTRVYRVRDGQLDVAAKHSRYHGLRRRFRLLRIGTPAGREFAAAHAMMQAGIPTAEPLAYRCRSRFGLPAESVLVQRWIADAPSLYRQTCSWALRQAAAEFAVRLFRAGLYPGDLNMGNLLARRTADDRFDLFLIDQVGLHPDQPMDKQGMARCLARFYLRACCPDAWGPWAALKWLAAAISRLELPLPDRRDLWRATMGRAHLRQDNLRRTFTQQVAKAPPTPDRPRLRKEVISLEQLARIVTRWRETAGRGQTVHSGRCSGNAWQTVSVDGRDWLVMPAADRAAADGVWLRLMEMWNLLVPAPRPGGIAVTGDATLVVAAPIAGQPIAQAMSTAQASEPAQRQLSWRLAKLIARLRVAGRSIPADAAGELVAIGQAGRIVDVGFARDVPVVCQQGVPDGLLGEWIDRLGELGVPMDGAFRARLVADVRRAIRLSRWVMA